MKEIQNKEKTQRINRIVPLLLKIIASVSIVTTLGIVLRSNETIMFFKNIIILLFNGERMVTIFEDPKFGILPLIYGTFLVTAIAMFVAIPISLACTVFLSEYASNSARKNKADVRAISRYPDNCIWFFALTVVTPLLQRIIPDLQFLMRLVQESLSVYDDAYNCISI